MIGNRRRVIARWKPIVAMTALFVIGVVVAAASVSQFLPFLAECAPVPGGDCRIGF